MIYGFIRTSGNKENSLIRSVKQRRARLEIFYHFFESGPGDFFSLMFLRVIFGAEHEFVIQNYLFLDGRRVVEGVETHSRPLYGVSMDYPRATFGGSRDKPGPTFGGIRETHGPTL